MAAGAFAARRRDRRAADGLGARIGFGCNIGAFVGGVASGSLHGWIWFAAALGGCAVGIRLRPLFGLSRE